MMKFNSPTINCFDICDKSINEKLVTVLERGAVKNESDKHINIQLSATSDRKESENFNLELEDALNQILNILGVFDTVKIEAEILEKMYESSVLKVYSQNLRRGENDLEKTDCES